MKKGINYPVILFGGESLERLVSVATAQHLVEIFPEAEIWFWSVGDNFHKVERQELLGHEKPFQAPFIPSTENFADSVDDALDIAAQEHKLLLLALHGGTAENGTFAAQCEKRQILFTGSGSRSSQLAFNKAAAKEIAESVGVSVASSVIASPSKPVIIEELLEWLSQYGKLVAKPLSDGSSYGLMFIETEIDLENLATASEQREYIVEPFVSGVETTVAVIQHNQDAIALPPVEIRPRSNRVFDYAGKYLNDGVEEICPSTFPESAVVALKEAALSVHKAIGAYGYSRSDFILTSTVPIFLEINTLPGLTKTSLLPIALRVSNISISDFLTTQIRLAEDRYINILSNTVNHI
ncbi:ATP-grasp domain-containing protein [Nostoc sp. FACHB-888]|uniref:ATP-grasp domain-containing protein n=1 Tax=Nostoc sp. FACHB-888 TaxID=2692842 RepID=UPI0016862989|nr:ATP-grasp domain-containing protein [Nostoc sp. FACHB-888]